MDVLKEAPVANPSGMMRLILPKLTGMPDGDGVLISGAEDPQAEMIKINENNDKTANGFMALPFILISIDKNIICQGRITRSFE